jgi:hypothetical protein
MAVAQGQFYVKYEDGTEATCPMFTSHILKMERRYGVSKPDGGIMMLSLGYLIHKGFWPHNDDALDAWADSLVEFDLLTAKGEKITVDEDGNQVIEQKVTVPDPFGTAGPPLSSPDSSPPPDSRPLSYSS